MLWSQRLIVLIICKCSRIMQLVFPFLCLMVCVTVHHFHGRGSNVLLVFFKDAENATMFTAVSLVVWIHQCKQMKKKLCLNSVQNTRHGAKFHIYSRHAENSVQPANSHQGCINSDKTHCRIPATEGLQHPWLCFRHAFPSGALGGGHPEWKPWVL